VQLQALQARLWREQRQRGAPVAHSEQEYLAMVDGLLLMTVSVSFSHCREQLQLQARVWACVQGVCGVASQKMLCLAMQGNPDSRSLGTSILKVLLASPPIS